MAKTKGKRVATVQVVRPSHVPVQLFPIWKGAAQSLANKHKLIKASGKVDYLAVNEEYRGMLAAYHKAATVAGRKASTEK